MNKRLIAQKIQMGNSHSYLSTVTLEWLATHVQFASKHPFLQSQINNKTQDTIRNEITIEQLNQRPLDWSRQSILTQYLLTRQHHKFPPLLLVFTSTWETDLNTPYWDEKQTAKKSSISFTPYPEIPEIGTIHLNDPHRFFALDGQHRLMGIQGLLELLSTGELPCYNSQKKIIGSPLILNNLVKTYSITEDTLKQLPQETIGIEIINAVQKKETPEMARKRVRSTFVHVNLMAVPLSKGQLTLLNEDNGYAIVARKIAVTHPFLQPLEDTLPRIDWDHSNILAKSPVLTTMKTLEDMTEKFLWTKYPHWKATRKGEIPQCPPPTELTEGIELFRQLWDYLSQLSSYKMLDQISPVVMRKFDHEKPSGRANILFRPVGQIAVAHAIGILYHRKHFSLGEIFEKLSYFDQNNGFDQIDNPRSLWYGMMYDPSKRKIVPTGKELMAKLLIYLCGGMTDHLEKAYLRESVAKSRSLGKQAVSFQGEWVALKEVGLPAPITLS